MSEPSRPRIAVIADREATPIIRMFERHADLLGPDAVNIDGIISDDESPLTNAIPHATLAALTDLDERVTFAETAFTHHRLRVAMENPDRPADALGRVHAAHKFLYMAHSPDGQKRLGRHVATGGAPDVYLAQAMDVMSVPTSIGKHVNVLQHILGYLSEELTAGEIAALHPAIAAYAHGEAERAVPLDLIRAHIRSGAPERWIANQVYLEPFPPEIEAP